MKHLLNQHHPRKHASSFKYAFAGILHALLNEANFRIHIIATVTVIVLGNHFNITNMEWAVIVLVTAMVLTAEMMNTVVEQVVDYLFKEKHPVAKIIKDLAAGYVLIFACAALIIFVLIFGHRLRGLYYDLETLITRTDLQSTAITRSEKVLIRNDSGKTNSELQTNVNDPEIIVKEDEYYGQSLGDECMADTDCIVSGCNSEICGNEELNSICILPDGPLPKDLGYKCQCVQNTCIWN